MSSLQLLDISDSFSTFVNLDFHNISLWFDGKINSSINNHNSFVLPLKAGNKFLASNDNLSFVMNSVGVEPGGVPSHTCSRPAMAMFDICCFNLCHYYYYYYYENYNYYCCCCCRWRNSFPLTFRSVPSVMANKVFPM